jgi:glycosyltransferase involved in cell wall biosynthesis
MIDVLFAIPELDRGGPDRVVFEILCNLNRESFAPSLLVESPRGHYLTQLPGDVRVDVLGDKGTLRSRYPVLKALRHIRRSAPDVVFATQRMILTLGLARPLFPRKTRLVLRQANDLSTDFDQLVKQSLVKHRVAREMAVGALRRADAVICQSEAMRSDLRGLLGARAPLHVISNPVDIDAVARSTAASEAELRGSPALVSMGRLMPQKGFDILLPAFARACARATRAHPTSYGDGPDRAKLIAQASELGVADAVTFEGFTTEPLPVLRAADVFVLASRWEGFPNAALEALACGTPVVLTNCPGANSEIVIAGFNGQLAVEVSPAAMAEALERAFAELATYDRNRIQANCGDRYSSRRIVGQYERVFAEVVT